MCHSVEMYLPQMARDAAEHRIGAADFAAAERERRMVGMGLALLGRIGRVAGFLIPKGVLLKLEKVPNPLKSKNTGFESESWLMGDEAQEPDGQPVAQEARA